MSPEQAGLDHSNIDTRTDIYALGIILYELLTSTTPLDMFLSRERNLLQLLKIIQEEDPVKPSSQLGSSDDLARSQITTRRKTDFQRLTRVLEGDLDWIVMKALAKEPTRRYESAIGFAEDIERYLNFKPVEARPPSVSYRMTEFVRKNRTLVFAASLLLIGVQVGIAGLVLGIIKAAKEAEKARIAQANAENSAYLADEARILAETAEQLKADAPPADCELCDCSLCLSLWVEEELSNAYPG